MEKRYENLNNNENTLEARYAALVAALGTLKHVIDILNENKNSEYYREFRDSKIQRFEYSMDSLWKFLKEYLEMELGIHLEKISPKVVFMSALKAGLIAEQELSILIRAMDDRNLTSHLYREVLAQETSERIDGYYPAIMIIVNRLH